MPSGVRNRSNAAKYGSSMLLMEYQRGFETAVGEEQRVAQLRKTMTILAHDDSPVQVALRACAATSRPISRRPYCDEAPW